MPQPEKGGEAHGRCPRAVAISSAAADPTAAGTLRGRHQVQLNTQPSRGKRQHPCHRLYPRASANRGMRCEPTKVRLPLQVNRAPNLIASKGLSVNNGRIASGVHSAKHRKTPGRRNGGRQQPFLAAVRNLSSPASRAPIGPNLNGRHSVSRVATRAVHSLIGRVVQQSPGKMTVSQMHQETAVQRKADELQPLGLRLLRPRSLATFQLLCAGRRVR